MRTGARAARSSPSSTSPRSGRDLPIPASRGRPR
jgi:hypothetical protein